jgi:hypothetical protein
VTHSNNQDSTLIGKGGLPKFGQFNSPVANLGLEQFCYFNNMDKPANKLSKYFDYKQFQFISINTGQFILGVAIADIRYLGSGFVYLYDITTNTMIEESWLRPPTLGYHVCPSPINGSALIGTKNNNIVN